jgi:hypothetical protein
MESRINSDMKMGLTRFILFQQPAKRSIERIFSDMRTVVFSEMKILIIMQIRRMGGNTVVKAPFN